MYVCISIRNYDSAHLIRILIADLWYTHYIWNDLKYQWPEDSFLNELLVSITLHSILQNSFSWYPGCIIQFNINFQRHTYIHNGSLQPHVMCVNLTMGPSERKTFEKLFQDNFLFMLTDFVRNLLRGNYRRNIFFFIFRFDLGYEPGLYV